MLLALTVPGATGPAGATAAMREADQLMFEYEQMSWLAPVACSESIIALVERQAELAGMPYERMPSSAGHDTQFFAGITEAGMIFVPSVGGVSHAPDEWTHWSDLELGSNLLLAAALELAR